MTECCREADHRDVRVGEAVAALGLLRAEQAVPVLIEHLKEESNDQLRVQIVRALGWIGSSTAVPALKEAALHDRYLYVRKNAAEALKEITGVEHDYDHTGEAEARKRVLDSLEARRKEREPFSCGPDITVRVCRTGEKEVTPFSAPGAVERR